MSPDSAVLALELANRVAVDGGMALIADYGHEGENEDTFRVSVKLLVLLSSKIVIDSRDVARTHAMITSPFWYLV